MGQHPLTTVQLAVALTIGSLASLVLGMMPVLLAALVSEGRIAEGAIGTLVTVELLAIAIGTVVGAYCLARLPASLVAALAAMLTALTNAAAISLDDAAGLAALRGCAGFAEGCLMSIALVAVARNDRPERASGFFLAAQTLLQLGALQIATVFTWDESAVDTYLVTIAAAGLLAAASAVALPWQIRPRGELRKAGTLSKASITGLVAAGAFVGATLTIWGYFGVWIGRQGFALGLEANAVALSLGAQVAGALVATCVGGRVDNRPWIVAASLGQILVVLTMLIGADSQVLIYVLAAAFGFLWLCAMPAFTGLLVDIDPTRRAATMIVAAQLGGAALVPLLAGRIVAERGLDGAFWLSAAIFAIAVLFVLGLRYKAAGREV